MRKADTDRRELPSLRNYMLTHPCFVALSMPRESVYVESCSSGTRGRRRPTRNEEHPTRERRNGEEIHRRGGGDVIRQEGSPRLRRMWAPSPQTRHGAFLRRRPQVCTARHESGALPQRVRRRHPMNEDAHLRSDARTAFRSGCRTSVPSAAEPVAMPSHDSSGARPPRRCASSARCASTRSTVVRL